MYEGLEGVINKMAENGIDKKEVEEIMDKYDKLEDKYNELNELIDYYNALVKNEEEKEIKNKIGFYKNIEEIDLKIGEISKKYSEHIENKTKKQEQKDDVEKAESNTAKKEKEIKELKQQKEELEKKIKEDENKIEEFKKEEEEISEILKENMKKGVTLKNKKQLNGARKVIRIRDSIKRAKERIKNNKEEIKNIDKKIEELENKKEERIETLDQKTVRVGNEIRDNIAHDYKNAHFDYNKEIPKIEIKKQKPNMGLLNNKDFIKANEIYDNTINNSDYKKIHLTANGELPNVKLKIAPQHNKEKINIRKPKTETEELVETEKESFLEKVSNKLNAVINWIKNTKIFVFFSNCFNKLRNKNTAKNMGNNENKKTQTTQQKLAKDVQKIMREDKEKNPVVPKINNKDGHLETNAQEVINRMFEAADKKYGKADKSR